MAYYKQMSASGQVKVGLGKLIGIVFSSTSTGTLALYDTPDGDTNDPKIIDTITPAAGTYMFFGATGIQFEKGLYAVEGGTLVWTIIYE